MSKSRAELCKAWRARNQDKVKEYSKKYYEEHRELCLLRNKRRAGPNYYGGVLHGYANSKIGWSKYKTNSLRASAKNRKHIFNITYTDILELMVDTCPILGIPLDYSLGGNKEKVRIESPSVDRIDNTKGYEKGNIIIISQLANKIKHSLTLEEIQNYLPKIIKFYKQYLPDNRGVNNGKI